MTTIDKIRAEIERRKELLTPHKGQGVILCREIVKQFDSLLSFIDTISQPMKDDIIDEIRAEIKRRFSEYNHDSNHHIQAAECASILDFLDTFEEPVSDCHDLEKAADNHIRKVVDAAGHPGWDWETQDIAEAFKAGAEWQKKHMTVTIKQSDLVGISTLKRDEHLH